jgi:hypothetical protein
MNILDENYQKIIHFLSYIGMMTTATMDDGSEEEEEEEEEI